MILFLRLFICLFEYISIYYSIIIIIIVYLWKFFFYYGGGMVIKLFYIFIVFEYLGIMFIF